MKIKRDEIQRELQEFERLSDLRVTDAHHSIYPLSGPERIKAIRMKMNELEEMLRYEETPRLSYTTLSSSPLSRSSSPRAVEAAKALSRSSSLTFDTSSVHFLATSLPSGLSVSNSLPPIDHSVASKILEKQLSFLEEERDLLQEELDLSRQETEIFRQKTTECEKFPSQKEDHLLKSLLRINKSVNSEISKVKRSVIMAKERLTSLVDPSLCDAQQVDQILSNLLKRCSDERCCSLETEESKAPSSLSIIAIEEKITTKISLMNDLITVVERFVEIFCFLTLYHPPSPSRGQEEKELSADGGKSKMAKVAEEAKSAVTAVALLLSSSSTTPAAAKRPNLQLQSSPAITLDPKSNAVNNGKEKLQEEINSDYELLDTLKKERGDVEFEKYNIAIEVDKMYKKRNFFAREITKLQGIIQTLESRKEKLQGELTSFEDAKQKSFEQKPLASENHSTDLPSQVEPKPNASVGEVENVELKSKLLRAEKLVVSVMAQKQEIRTQLDKATSEIESLKLLIKSSKVM